MAPRELESIENQAAGLHAPLISFPTLGLGGLAFLPLHIGTSGWKRVTGWPGAFFRSFIRVRRDGYWRLWHLAMNAISGASVGISSATQAFSKVGVRDAQRRYGRVSELFSSCDGQVAQGKACSCCPLVSRCWELHTSHARKRELQIRLFQKFEFRLKFEPLNQGERANIACAQFFSSRYQAFRRMPRACFKQVMNLVWLNLPPLNQMVGRKEEKMKEELWEVWLPRAIHNTQHKS